MERQLHDVNQHRNFASPHLFGSGKMFGQPIVPLGKPPPPRKFPKERGKWGPRPQEWAVVERVAGSDFKKRQIQEEARKKADALRKDEGIEAELRAEAVRNDCIDKAQRKGLAKLVKRKVELALQSYEDDLEERRERLRQLLLKENVDMEREMVIKSQTLLDHRAEELREKAQRLRNARDAERKAIVEQKRMQQYRDRCDELRPLQSEKTLRASKEAQLFQIKEREMLRAREREIDNMWTAVMLKERAAKAEREARDEMERYSKDMSFKETLKMQMAGIEMQHKQREAIKAEECIELEKLQEATRLEEIQILEDKIKKRDASAVELREQIVQREKFLEQRRNEEIAIDNTFTRLAQAELDRERGSIVDNSERMRREMQMYRESLEELRKEREAENMELERLLLEEQRIANERRDNNRRIIRAAKQKLLDETISGRHEQLEHKKQMQLDEARRKAVENELADKLREMNQDLDAKLKNSTIKQQQLYGEDLLKQIEYNNLLRKREQEELDCQFLNGQMEEEQYVRLIRELLANPKLLMPHPFMAPVMGDLGGLEELGVNKCACSPEPGKLPLV